MAVKRIKQDYLYRYRVLIFVSDESWRKSPGIFVDFRRWRKSISCTRELREQSQHPWFTSCICSEINLRFSMKRHTIWVFWLRSQTSRTFNISILGKVPRVDESYIQSLRPFGKCKHGLWICILFVFLRGTTWINQILNISIASFFVAANSALISSSCTPSRV
jgi:hypothetical protein